MKTSRASIVLLAAALCAAPAFADDGGTIRDRLREAAANVQSFQANMDLHLTLNGAAAPLHATGTVTAVLPDTMKMTITAGALTIEEYAAGDFLYLHGPDGTWRKISRANLLAQPSAAALLQAIKDERVSVLPDAVEDGVTVGMVAIDAQLPQLPAIPSSALSAAQHMRCSYDKTNFRLHLCRNDAATVTFGKYNDPTNTVDLPPQARDAQPMAIGRPVPRRSPDPDAGDAGATTVQPTPAAGDTPASSAPSATPSP